MNIKEKYEKSVEKEVGLSIEVIKKIGPGALKRHIEKKTNKKVKFVSNDTPVITTNELDKKVNKILW